MYKIKFERRTQDVLIRNYNKSNRIFINPQQADVLWNQNIGPPDYMFGIPSQ